MGDEWKSTTVGDFCPFIYGKGLPEVKRKKGNIKVYGSNGVVGVHDEPLIEKQGIIIGRKGTVGAVHYSTEPFWPIDTTYYVTSAPDRDLRFTYYMLKSLGLEKMNSHSAVPGLNRDAAHSKKILVPSLEEQSSIAHILGSLDDKIELNHKMNKTLEAMAQALFKSWFVDFDPVIDNALAAGNPIPEELKARAEIRKSLGDVRKPLPDEVRALFPSEFVKTEEMGWVPSGWKAVSVDKVIEINPSLKLKKGETALNVDMKAIPTSGYSITEVVKKAYSGGAKFQNGDVLLARITPCLENGKTGIVDFLVGDEVAFGSTEFIVMRGKGSIRTTYIACLARTNEFREHCIQSMVGSSGRQRVQNACFSNYFLALPNHEEIPYKFNKLTLANFEKITRLSKQSQTLIKLRDNLLPKILSGEMRICEIKKNMEKVL